MRHAEHGRFIHRRMLVNGRFDFGRIDVFTSTQDHVFSTVFDVQEALFVNPTDVAAAEPAVNNGLSSCFGLLPVATDQRWGLHPNLPSLANRHALEFIITNVKVHDDCRRTAR